MTRVEAIVLDMDGVMLDTEPLYKSAWQTAAAELGYELDDASYLNVAGRTTHDGEQELARTFGPGFSVAEFDARWSALWRRQVETAGISLKAGLTELLAFAGGRSLPVAVATSTYRGDAVFSLRRAGLAGRFPIVVTGDEVAHGKPAPDIFLEAARRLGVAPARCVAVEDSDAGILAAHRAGMTPIYVPDLRPPSAAVRASAFRVVPSLREACKVIAELIENATE